MADKRRERVEEVIEPFRVKPGFDPRFPPIWAARGAGGRGRMKMLHP
jgi:hypothetical protein